MFLCFLTSSSLLFNRVPDLFFCLQLSFRRNVDTLQSVIDHLLLKMSCETTSSGSRSSLCRASGDIQHGHPARHVDYEADDEDESGGLDVSTALEKEYSGEDSDDEDWDVEGIFDSDEESDLIVGDPAYSHTTSTLVSRDYYPLPPQQAYFDAYEAANRKPPLTSVTSFS